MPQIKPNREIMLPSPRKGVSFAVPEALLDEEETPVHRFSPRGNASDFSQLMKRKSYKPGRRKRKAPLQVGMVQLPDIKTASSKEAAE